MGEKPTGEQLYALYAEAHRDLHDCHCDPWDQLDTEERDAWDELADRVEVLIERRAVERMDQAQQTARLMGRKR